MTSPQQTDGSPVRQPRSLKSWFERFKESFQRHREPDDATSPIILRPTFFRRQPMSVKPFPPRTLKIGIPGLFHFNLHFNSTRKGQSKGWTFLGNCITWSRSMPGEHRLRKLATRQLKRDIAKATDGKPINPKDKDPRTASSGDHGSELIAGWNTSIRQHPAYQWGLPPSKVAMINPYTNEFVFLDPQGRPYVPTNPFTDPYGNAIVYGRDGQPMYGGPPFDPSTYGQFGPSPFGQMGGPQVNPAMYGQFGSSPYNRSVYSPYAGSPFDSSTSAQYGTSPYDATTFGQYGYPYDGYSPGSDMDLRLGMSDPMMPYRGSRIRGSPPTPTDRIQGDGRDPTTDPDPVPAASRASPERNIGLDM